MESQTHRNPETGEVVSFSSLPSEEQKRLHAQWEQAQQARQNPAPQPNPPAQKPKKRPTFEAARGQLFPALKKSGWEIKEHLKLPQATKQIGSTKVTLFFKPQAVWAEVKGKTSAAPRSLWVDIRDIAHDADGWVQNQLPGLLEHFTGVKLAADKWKKMPKGWTSESRKKFWDSLTGDVKHKVTKCIERMDGKVDDPGAFCAALSDRVDPGWRSRKAFVAALNQIATDVLLRSRYDYNEVSSERPHSRLPGKDTDDAE